MFITFYSDGISHTNWYITCIWLSMGLSIVYLKASQVEFFQIMLISVPDGCFNHSKQCRPWWNAAFCSISPGSTLFVKCLVILLLWIICLIYVLCLSCFHVCSLLPRGHLKGKGLPLGSCLWCLLWFCYFPIWYPGTGVVLNCIDSWSLLSFLLSCIKGRTLVKSA